MHYFDNDPKLKSDEKTVIVNFKNDRYVFYTDNGVFSKKGLDFGTRTLLEALPLEKIKGDVLDLGCGYGPIGIILAKNTNASIDMLDINKRSVNLATKNAKENNVAVNVFESDKYDKVIKKYDYIITNPPVRVGKKILYEILFDAKKYLKSNGELWLVINKEQGAKSLIKDLCKEYNVEVVEKNKGFYVIRAASN